MMAMPSPAEPQISMAALTSAAADSTVTAPCSPESRPRKDSMTVMVPSTERRGSSAKRMPEST
jgi:hypothetical protein